MPARLRGERLLNHMGLALSTGAGCILVMSARPLGLVHGLTISLGYISLILVVASLVIGPAKLLGRRRNPVNINLRRDMGIWAGITGLLHVFFGLQIHVGGQILLYFFTRTANGGYAPQLNLFGLGNYVGLAATLLVALLLTLSNDVSLRRLKGPRWKAWQRLNYLLLVLVVTHMLLYQEVVLRDTIIRQASYVVVAVALAAQAAGFYLYRRKRRASARSAPRPATPPQSP